MPFYTPTGNPGSSGRGLSSLLRAEFDLIAAAFAMVNPVGGTAVSMAYRFSTTTTVADPGAGYIRLNNATQNTATALLVDLVDVDGTTRTSTLDTFDDSTSTLKGSLLITGSSDSSKFLLLSISAMASPAGYRNFTCTVTDSSAANPFANDDYVTLSFSPTGDKGDPGGSSLTLAERTSNTILTVTDNAKLINVTSGTFSQTFDPVATIGADWWVVYANSGTGVITLDPDGTEQIDGLTSYKMYPGEVRLIQCNGSKLTTAVLKPFYYTITATEVFTKPPGYKAFSGLLWGGGGAGGMAAGNGGGGGGAACAQFQLLASAVGATETVTIATATAGIAGNGSSGGNSTFGSLVTAYGGGGGAAAANSGGGGGGGLLSAGAATTSQTGGAGGNPGGAAAAASNDGFGGGGGGTQAGTTTGGSSAYGGGGGGAEGGNGGSSVWGGGGGGGSTAGTAGTSIYGGAGGAGRTGAAGFAGTAPGGGGGGSDTSLGGDGARGECRIWGVS